MRILHIGRPNLPIGSAYGGATERRMLELARAQIGRGHQVCIVSPEGIPPGVVADQVEMMQVKTSIARPLRDYEYLMRAGRRMRGWRPDVVHAHAAADAVALRPWVPAIYALTFDYFRYHGSETRLGRSYWRRCLKAFDLLLPVSGPCGNQAAEFYGLERSRLHVLYNGVDVGQFAPDPEAGEGQVASRQWGRDEVRVLYLGRVCRQKGTDVLLDAFTQAVQHDDRLRLVIAGPIGQFGDDRGDPEAFLPRLSAPQVHYLGAVHEQDLRGLMNAAHVFCMPTVRDEMFGMAALEAQAAGLPVVASRVGGLVEAVGPHSGLLIEAGDSHALSDALLRLADDPALRDEMSAAGPAHAARFSWPVIAAEADRLYDSVASPSGVAAG